MSLHVDIHKSLGDFSLDVNVDAQTETLGFLGASAAARVSPCAASRASRHPTRDASS